MAQVISDTAFSSWGWRNPELYESQSAYNRRNPAAGQLEQQQGYNVTNQATQQGFNVQNQATQQGYNAANIATQQGYNVANAATQQGYYTSNLAQQLAGGLQQQTLAGQQNKELQELLARLRAAESAEQQKYNAANIESGIAGQLRMGSQSDLARSKLSAQEYEQAVKMGGENYAHELALRKQRMGNAQEIFDRYASTGGEYERALMGQAASRNESSQRQWEEMQRDIESTYAGGGASLSSERGRSMSEGLGALAMALRQSRTTAQVEVERAKQDRINQLFAAGRG